MITRGHATLLIAALFVVVSGCASRTAIREPFPAFSERIDATIRGFSPKGLNAVLVVHQRGETILKRTLGTATLQSRFDVASLAKPLAGVPLALLQMDESSQGAAMFQGLMAHLSGFKDEEAYDSSIDSIPDTYLFKGSDKKILCYQYSNISYYHISRHWRGTRLEARESIRQHFWQPAGTTFPQWDEVGTPIMSPGLTADGTPLRGPYDRLAALQLLHEKGFPVHSGLLASAEEVSTVVDWWTMTGANSVWSRTLLGEVREVPRCEGGTVWISPGGLVSPTEPPMVPVGSKPGRIFFITGFTGCLLWVDLRTQTTVIFLSDAGRIGAFEQVTALQHDILSEVFALLRGAD